MAAFPTLPDQLQIVTSSRSRPDSRLSVQGSCSQAPPHNHAGLFASLKPELLQIGRSVGWKDSPGAADGITCHMNFFCRKITLHSFIGHTDGSGRTGQKTICDTCIGVLLLDQDRNSPAWQLPLVWDHWHSHPHPRPHRA